MRPRILVPYDFGPASESALSWAADLKAALGALPIHVVHVIEPIPLMAPEMVSIPALSEREIADRRGAVERAAKKLDAAATSELLFAASPGPAIVEAATGFAADLIVMGTHGRTGLARFAFGSVAEFVVRHACCAVVTIRALPEEASRAA